MSKSKLYTIIGVLIVLAVLAWLFVPNYLANRITPHFDPAKVAEIKDRNLAQYNEFINDFNKARDQIKKDPKNADAWTTIGLVADTLNDDKLAERAYKEALSIEPALYLPKNNLAVIYKQQGQYQLAKDLYLNILKDRPADTQTYYALAQMHASNQAGNLQDAKNILAEGIKQTNDQGLKDLLKKLEKGEKVF